jgi:hypothetical protein
MFKWSGSLVMYRGSYSGFWEDRTLARVAPAQPPMGVSFAPTRSPVRDKIVDAKHCHARSQKAIPIR